VGGYAVDTPAHGGTALGDAVTVPQPRSQESSTRPAQSSIAEPDVQEATTLWLQNQDDVYLDVVHAASQFVNPPIASYIISGEMAMIEVASDAGAINREQAILEILMATQESRATIICTYWLEHHDKCENG
jgi:porphobilinogen synthase